MSTIKGLIGSVFLLAVLGVTGCTQVVSGTAVAPTSAGPANIKDLLLDEDEVNSIMETSNLVLAESGDGLDDTIDASPSECHGVIYISGEEEYGDTDFTEMRWEAIASEDGSVVQSVAKFPSPSDASAFVEDQSASWEACRKVTITAVSKEDGTKSRYQVRSISAQNDKVMALTVLTDTDLQCQHVLQAVSSFVLDISACGSNISDEAETVASKIASKIDDK